MRGTPLTIAFQLAIRTGTGRERLRLLQALRLLAAGDPVTSVALDLGYASTSAFIFMFKRAIGTTPGRYFRTPSTRV